MSTGNIDVKILAEALTVALQPLKELQQKQLVMQTLSAFYTPSEIKEVRGEFARLHSTISSRKAGITLAERMKKDQEEGYAKTRSENDFNEMKNSLEKLESELEQLTRSHALLIQALRISNEL